MITVTMEVDIPPSRELHLRLPLGAPIGRQTVSVTIEVPAGRAPLDLPVHDFGPWPAGLTLSRDELYGDDGR